MTAPKYDEAIPAPAHGGRFTPDPPAFDVVHSTEGPMADGNAHALAVNWFGRPQSAGGAGTSTTGIFDPVGSVRMLDEHTIPYHVGPVGNGLSTGDEHCGSVSLTAAQWMSPRGQAMLDASAKVKAQRAIFRGWALSDCRWLTLTEVARRTVKGFCTHNDVRLALGGTTHSDPGPNFPYSWYMGRIRYWFQFLTGAIDPEDFLMAVNATQDEWDAVVKAARQVNATAIVGTTGFEGTVEAMANKVNTLINEVRVSRAIVGDDEANLTAKLDDLKADVDALKQPPSQPAA